MKIQGKLGTYDVKYRSYGFTSAQAVVYPEPQYKKFLGFIKIRVNRTAPYYDTNHLNPYRYVENMTPDEMAKWFSQVVRSYEKSKVDWAEVSSDKVYNAYS